MSLLLPLDLPRRRAETAPGTSLGTLADALAAELRPWLDPARPLPIPSGKARLTRDGGRCPVHGTYLEFDPATPREHRCRACGTAYVGQGHDDWWAMGAQLFTAERAVHAAALHALRGDPAHRAFAERVLGTLAARYRTYPNQDNALGPTRPFFSTYLESIWLLNVCHALALLEATGPSAIGDTVRAELIAPSRALIASFDEGRSNRQVWNGAAMLAASVLLADAPAVRALTVGAGSLPALLEDGCGEDGGWYEGENYHLFAHRGFWYAVQTMIAQKIELAAPLLDRFRRGFAFPFSGLLPDECFPSRRDSQYRVSIRQWRIAEYLELGVAFGDDPILAGLLTRVYDGRVSRVSDARARSTADAERNEPPMWLDRASLSWRALLMARPEPAPVTPWRPASASRVHEGLALIRRDAGEVVVGLEGGGDVSGHGHPDTLALTLQQGPSRWLEDPGAGSYVDRSLFWYRSTLAHHAPLVNEASQRARSVDVLDFEDRGGAGWMRKRVTLENGAVLTRTVVVADGYLVDLLEWQGGSIDRLTLPLAADVAAGDVHGAASWRPTSRTGAGGEEDGYGFLEAAVEASLHDSAARWTQRDPTTGHQAQAWYAASTAATLLHATVPGVPGASATTRLFVECDAPSGAVVGVWGWHAPDRPTAVTDVTLTPGAAVVASVRTADGTMAEHGAAPHGWHIALAAGSSRSSIDLEGHVARHIDLRPAAGDVKPVRRLDVPAVHQVPALGDQLPASLRCVLTRDAYVQTEEAWGAGNAPQAEVQLAATGDRLIVRVTVMTGHAVVTTGGDVDTPPANPLDNDPADVNADGLQWYLGEAGRTLWSASELVVPLTPDHVRRTTLDGAGSVRPTVESRWVDERGWAMQLVFDRRTGPLASVAPVFHLTINERPTHRARRRGQLRLAGGGFTRYISGAREDPRYSACALLLPPPGPVTT